MKIPLPAGTYDFEDGRKLIVSEEGIIGELTESAEEPAAEEPAADAGARLSVAGGDDTKFGEALEHGGGEDVADLVGVERVA